MNVIFNDSIAELNQFEREDIFQALRSFKQLREKNKTPEHTYEGRTGLLITVSIKKQYHITWRANP